MRYRGLQFSRQNFSKNIFRIFAPKVNFDIFSDGNAAGQAKTFDSLSIYPVIRKNNENQDQAKNKDGNGNKRKNRRENGDALTSGDVRILASPKKHYSHIEEFVAHEEILLNGFFNVLSQVKNQIFAP